jgi:hypothetical protein
MANLQLTNLTDHPSQTSLLIDIYNGTLAPGETATIAVDRINEKINGLIDAGYISVGELPEYYKKWKFADDYKPPVFIIETVEDSEPIKISTESIDETSKKKKNIPNKG